MRFQVKGDDLYENITWLEGATAQPTKEEVEVQLKDYKVLFIKKRSVPRLGYTGLIISTTMELKNGRQI